MRALSGAAVPMIGTSDFTQSGQRLWTAQGGGLLDQSVVFCVVGFGLLDGARASSPDDRAAKKAAGWVFSQLTIIRRTRQVVDGERNGGDTFIGM